ncbi:hypothetical protein ACKVMT_08815 [Halobacteriales archaeon Cl-PHB]
MAPTRSRDDTPDDVSTAGGRFACPDCGATLRRADGTLSCVACRYVPSHGAD